MRTCTYGADQQHVLRAATNDGSDVLLGAGYFTIVVVLSEKVCSVTKKGGIKEIQVVSSGLCDMRVL